MTWKINSERLPVKLHYLTYFGGVASLWPFIQVIGRQWGIKGSSIGFIFTVAFLLASLLSPLVIRLAGRVRWRKPLLLFIIALQLLATVGISLLPSSSPFSGKRHNYLEKADHFIRPVTLACNEYNMELYLRQCTPKSVRKNCHYRKTIAKYFHDDDDNDDDDDRSYTRISTPSPISGVSTPGPGGQPGSWWSSGRPANSELSVAGTVEYCDVRCAIDSQSLDMCDFFDDPSKCGKEESEVFERRGNESFIKFDMKVQVSRILRNDSCLLLPVQLISFDGKRLWSECPSGGGGSRKSSEAVILDYCFVDCFRNNRVNSIMETQAKPPVSWDDSEFWIFATLSVVMVIFMMVVSYLADGFCLEMLEKRGEVSLFVWQKVWALVGWGVFVQLSGLLVDLDSEDKALKDYTKCFYMSCGMIVINFFVTLMWQVEEYISPEALRGNFKAQLKSLKSLIFLFSCLIVGFCVGLQTNFLLWFMEDVTEAPENSQDECNQKDWLKTTQGLMTAMETFATEIPVFLLSYWITRKLGHDLCLSIILVVFGLRFLLTSFVTNPFVFLPLALFQGPSVGLFFPVILRQAQMVKPKGTQIFTAILGALTFKGLGMAVGSLVAGLILLDNEPTDCQLVFQIFSGVALTAAVVNTWAKYGLQDNLSNGYSSAQGSEEMDCEKELDSEEMIKINGEISMAENDDSEKKKRERSSGGRGATAMKKFKLLLWKNFKIQTRHKFQTVVEICIPLVFMIALATIRVLIPLDYIKEPTIFEPFELKGNVPVVLRTLTDEIYYTPSSPYIDEVMKKVNDEFFSAQGLKYTFKSFPTEEKLVKAYERSSDGYTGKDSGTNAYNVTAKVLAGVVFDKHITKDKIPANIKYSLKLPAYQRTEFDVFSERFTFKPAWFTDMIYPLFRLLGPRSNKANGGFPGYFAEGFLYIQYAIDSVITKSLLNQSDVNEYNKLDVKMQRFPYPPFIADNFVFATQFWMPFFITLSFIYPCMNITKVVVYEKECRLKEFMKMQGLPNWLHWTAWFIKAFLFLIGTLILMTLLMKIPFTEDRAILTESNALVVLTVFICHSITIIGYCFFMSTLFSTANSAATAAGFLWLMLFLPYGFLFPRLGTLSRATKLLTCILLANNPMSYACQIFATFEGFEEGIQWRLIDKGVSPDDTFCILDCMMMMVGNGLVFMLAAFYIEIVWPGKYGVGLPWYFFLTKWYWTDSIRPERPIAPPTGNTPKKSKKAGNNNSSYFEMDPPNSKAGIQIQGLTKVFGKKTAVNSLNLNLFENQITALLGHNGAGKTTTMSMLTGLLTPTRGTALINGFDICQDMVRVRANLGLCPQYDVLFDELTVEEHLQFYSILKGYNDEETEEEIERMLAELGFEAKRHAQSHTLSGGQKRKLSVGIAFCAGSKCVLLDEPTSGMDVGSRRSTWDLIQTEKRGRTVVISTHFMEEADLLGDRIAIMAEGQVQCCGSSLFLKKRYGGDYRLIIVKDPDCQVDNITNILKAKIPSVRVMQDVGAELAYSLEDESSKEFPALFHELEEKKDELGIASYGVGNTTIEEVFMRVGEIAAEEKNRSKGGTFSKTKSLEKHGSQSARTFSHGAGNNKGRQFSGSAAEEKKLLGFSGLDGERNKGSKLTIQQFKAMLTKKIIYSLRNRGLAFLQIGIPIALLFVCILAIKSIPAIERPVAHTITLDRYETLGKTITAVSCSRTDKICNGYRSFVGEKYKVQDIRNIPVVDFILDRATEDLPYTNSKYMVGFEQRTKFEGPNGKIVGSELVAYFNNQPFHTPPLALNYVSNGILRAFGVKHRITVTNHPFDYNAIDQLKQSGSFFTMTFMASWVIAFGMAFLGASFIIFPIHERMTHSKHLQFVAGVKYPIYWAAAYAIDFVNYMIPCVLMLLLMFAMKVDEFYDKDVWPRYLLLCVAHGWCTVTMMSLFSFAFSIPSSGYARMVAFGAASGLLPMLTMIILDVPEFDLEDLTDNLHKICLIIPNYALGMGIIRLISHSELKQFCSTFDLDTFCTVSPNFKCCTKLQGSFFDWEPYGLGQNIFWLFTVGLICVLLLAIIESNVITKLIAMFQWRNEWEMGLANTNEATLDDDVEAEKVRINSQNLSMLSQKDNLILRNLTKIYGNKFLAVDHLTMGVHRGETFGLLGVNGAGKTTTFKMLTGDHSVSEGDAYLCTYSIRKNLKKVHENLGYCPQFDALVEQLTGRETIRMFARLKGIKDESIDGIIQILGEALLFTQHLDKKVEDYSGGNKRKLSTSVAMIGNPAIVFLDEPTTGMDPTAKRHVWSAVSRIKEIGTSVLLTSHSMEECEALCNRIAIMVNGRFQCLGSVQHLKNKFAEGYSVVAQLNYTASQAQKAIEEPETASTSSSVSCYEDEPDLMPSWETELAPLKNYIEAQFPGCVLKDSHPGFVEYHVANDEHNTWAKLFAVMEKAKDEFNLEAYSVGQTSLEQIFFIFTKMQNSPDD